VDVALVRPPLHGSSLDVRELFREPRVAAVGAGHAFAGLGSVPVEGLLDDPVVATLPRSWGSFWSCDELRGSVGRPAGVATSVSESLDCVAYLGAVDTLPASSARYYRHPGVSYVGLADAPFASAAVARRRDDRRALVESFCRITQHVTARHLELVAGAVAP